MVLDETRPKKRGRTALGSSSIPSHDSTGSYLTCFDERKPIAIVVSPLKMRQGAILARNLRDAGAHVIEDFTDFEKDKESPANTDILVVTDEKSRAEARLGEGVSAFRSLQYVSTKWASKVLSAQSPVPVESYLLGSSAGQLTTTGGHMYPSKPTPDSTNKPFLPVWCSRGLGDTGDVAEKQAILRRLPPYLCERSTITQSIYPSPNNDICAVLEQMAKRRILERAGGSNAAADIRARAYRLASSALKCVPFELKTQQDAQTLHSFGPRVLAVVSEYLTSGQVHEVSALESDARLSTLAEFQEMYGVGATSARDLYDLRGIKSVAQLRERVRSHPGEFSAPLVEYLQHYDALARMDLKSAVTCKQRVEDLVNEPGQGNLHLRFVLCGGFRRGEQSGHDVDLLYCRRRELVNDNTSALDQVVKRLLDSGLLISVLSLATNADGWHERRYVSEASRSVYRYAHDVLHGMASFGGRVFRLDIVGVRDAAEFPFATLAWSGSTAFQRDIRQLCEKKKNWIFNQHGVFERAGGQRVELNPTPKSEMDVFAAMGLSYRPSFERSC